MRHGFTLAELLMALLILAVIATYTIPKVLVSQQDARFTAIGKEAAGMLSAARLAHMADGSLSANTTAGDLTQYINYVRVDTASSIDLYQTQGSVSCSATLNCLVLHNGAKLMFSGSTYFGGTATTNAIWFRLDPDGAYSGTTNGAGKTVALWLYYNGKVRTYGTIDTGTVFYSGGSPVSNNPISTVDPPWFSWD